MATNLGKPYKPRDDVRRMLGRAFELVSSVAYRVSARWVFYRLLQEAFFSHKKDYNAKLLPALSAARKRNYQQWRPDTLADETREAIIRGNGHSDERAFIQNLAYNGVVVELDKWIHQRHYVELWYEARAMTDQFRHYTEHITLVPMGGQPSIPYKYAAAQRLDWAARTYGNSVVILYFGDLDKAGQTIARTIEEEVRWWCDFDFEFVYCGLTLDQVRRYDVPENPEKPSQYQWEAVSDEAAGEIIAAAISRFVRQDSFSEVCGREYELRSWVNDELANMVSRWDAR